MDLSSFLSVPPTHSSITDSPYLAGVDFDWFPDSLKLWSSEVSESYGGVSPSSQPLHPLTQRPTTIQYHPINPPLQNNEFSHRHRQRQPAVSSPSASFTGGDNVPKTIFFRAGDFQKNQRAESPVSCESSITIEGMSKACRYSPEEKKERIERYKTKRSQRNFNKKIKYACRKSLADSRPRVRGRFARYNEEVVKNHGVQWSHGRDEGDETNDGDNWIKYFIDAYSANLIP